ncbi:Glucuronoyl esterase catalytic domain from Hypocrea Jecorina [Elsinoe ampelina]|uniref:(4-O-methyl)-D-glucuronate--lignin esterase n=1 Tax=Elsinoe ampelina TaxID=302913 RepID=A0A6A6GJE5_9PEZI|nr:Glucuronoyl esterase catalytic domain from Hypocrea Jecorina [Elsinoe ampelina]
MHRIITTLALAGALGSGAVLQERQATCAAIPANPALTSVAALPNPFTTFGGQAVTTRAQWTCRQAEISSLFQRYELGTKPAAPNGLTASFSGTTLSITSTINGKSMTFSVTIRLPTTGTAPYPAIIAYGAPSIPIPAGVATIIFDNSAMAQQTNTQSRGQGLFYNLYGAQADAAATTAWAWGVSRIIDALALTPSAQIDPARVGVTGCSRNGKGAFIAGALDSRIALTIPQESGSGGASCWRLSDDMLARGINTQTARQIVTENVWFSQRFASFGDSVNTLPVDHHLLVGLVAPRGLLVIENTDFEWLGPWSAFGCMTAGRRVYEALEAKDRMGFTQVGGHQHCQFPESQRADLEAFVGRFLLRRNTSTDIFKTDVGQQFDEGRWAPWTTPRLV